MVSPLCLQIVLHYAIHFTDFRDGDFSAPAVRDLLNWLHQEGVIDPMLPNSHIKYVITDKGRAYVEFLIQMPFPVAKWVMP